jgi:MoCo/4Fe-4S cofactor protein with predicted Tat translocation signal
MNNHSPTTQPLDLAAVRARLQQVRGQEYWRSLEELAASTGFQAFIRREFPQQASALGEPVGRRRFLQLMAASLALAGVTACTRQPEEKIMPYVRQPEDIVQGAPLFFATAMPFGGFGYGVLAESHMGRPTKIEGNPQHPASLGATDAFGQASVLTLYDPDRSQVITNAGMIRTWGAFIAALNSVLDDQRTVGGGGLRLLTGTVTSPTLAQQLRTLLERFPAAVWHQYEPAGSGAARAGARLAFGGELDAQYRFDKADVILALDADFLSCGPAALRYARDFAGKRRVWQGERTMHRLYAVESTPSLTGTMADHRLPLRSGEVAAFAHAVARELGALPGRASAAQTAAPATHARWVRALADDLRQHQGSGIVIAGEQQPPLVHALAHAMNYALGNIGKTVFYTDPIEAAPTDQTASLRELASDMAAGAVELLVIIGGNPVYTAPADLQFAEHLAKVPLRVHLSLYHDETSALCHWHIPATHYLETWGDIRSHDGTVTIIQPLIAPLYAGRSAHEVLAALLGQPDGRAYDIVRGYWRGQRPGEDFERFWRTALHDGLVDGTALAPRPIEGVRLGSTDIEPPASPPAGLELIFRPDPTVWDGRFANNGWLQELPKPLTKLTWDNAALISPATAERLGLATEDLVELRYQGRTVRAPVWVMPGHVDDAVTVSLGYGRWRAGQLGTNTGFNAYALRTSDAPWFGPGLEVVKTGERYRLATTQGHFRMEGRNLVRTATLAEYLAHPDFVHALGHEPAPDQTLYPLVEYPGYAWGMAIDLNACIGCSACVVACQAENNVPIVGKTEVARGREMHWLRIDRYYRGGLDRPATYYQPILCMHCETAPCEVVCPVAATVHGHEGLNEMVYNRCVGTRYCSNNCPYKVRRFNFFQYADYTTPSLKLLHNPDVTVRSRGVMEKCTYCVQRINAGRVQAEREGRSVRDGEIVTACQASCPTEAIIFGNINDPNSRVAKMKGTPLNYGLLTELNTRPRTTYLARLRNPNPELMEGGTQG